jgi:hypothetical protein
VATQTAQHHAQPQRRRTQQNHGEADFAKGDFRPQNPAMILPLRRHHMAAGIQNAHRHRMQVPRPRRRDHRVQDRVRGFEVYGLGLDHI